MKVWIPISEPSARISRTSAGSRATDEPTTKNVPGTWYFASTASTWGVQVASGPSSKVSATVLGGSEMLCWRPCVRSMTGPPSATDAGTSPSGPSRPAPRASIPICDRTRPFSSRTLQNIANTSPMSNHFGPTRLRCGVAGRRSR